MLGRAEGKGGTGQAGGSMRGVRAACVRAVVRGNPNGRGVAAPVRGERGWAALGCGGGGGTQRPRPTADGRPPAGTRTARPPRPCAAVARRSHGVSPVSPRAARRRRLIPGRGPRLPGGLPVCARRSCPACWRALGRRERHRRRPAPMRRRPSPAPQSKQASKQRASQRSLVSAAAASRVTRPPRARCKACCAAMRRPRPALLGRRLRPPATLARRHSPLPPPSSLQPSHAARAPPQHARRPPRPAPPAASVADRRAPPPPPRLMLLPLPSSRADTHQPLTPPLQRSLCRCPRADRHATQPHLLCSSLVPLRAVHSQRPTVCLSACRPISAAPSDDASAPSPVPRTCHYYKTRSPARPDVLCAPLPQAPPPVEAAGGRPDPARLDPAAGAGPHCRLWVPPPAQGPRPAQAPRHQLHPDHPPTDHARMHQRRSGLLRGSAHRR